MRRLTTIFITGSLLVSACTCTPSNGDTHPIDYRETPVPVNTDLCGQVEKHLRDMCQADGKKNFYCCQVVADTKKGKSFETFCHETQDNGVYLDPQCLSSIVDCQMIDMCTGTVRDK